MALETVDMRKGRPAALPRLSKPYDPNKPRDRRYWSDADLQVLRENFAKPGGVDACCRALPHRSRISIYQTAGKQGLKAWGNLGGKRERHALTPEIEARMREAWPSLTGRGAQTLFIEKDLGVRKHVGMRWAVSLGLATLRRKEPPWTPAEDLLMGKVPLHSPARCAAMFREHGFARTPTAITIRAKRLGLSRRYRETLSGTTFAKILGVDNKTTTQWCVLGTLPATRRESERLPQQGGAPWSITRAAARQFILDNLATIDIRKVEKVAFVDLLVNVGAGAEGSD